MCFLKWELERARGKCGVDFTDGKCMGIYIEEEEGEQVRVLGWDVGCGFM